MSNVKKRKQYGNAVILQTFRHNTVSFQCTCKCIETFSLKTDAFKAISIKVEIFKDLKNLSRGQRHVLKQMQYFVKVYVAFVLRRTTCLSNESVFERLLSEGK